MPQHTRELNHLITSFLTDIQHIIDAEVTARLDGVFDDLRLAIVPQVAPARVPAPTPRKRARPVTLRPPSPRPPLSPPPPPVVTLPKPKVATVIPANVKITRLPPGPSPKQAVHNELRSQCRVPGCPDSNSGPRYDMMCRDHYAKLNAEDRRKYKAMWYAAHATA